VVQLQGFLLGLANGISCLAFCIPILVPFFLHERRDTSRNFGILAKFLGGRLGGYILFALLAWATGNVLLAAASVQSIVIGSAYVGLSALLIISVFRRQPEKPDLCAVKDARNLLGRWPALLPAGMGFLAGLKVCPPLLLAFAGAASLGSLGGSLLLFLAFFVGTSLYFLPLPFLGSLARFVDLRLVARFAAVIVAVYYFFSGTILLVGGII
jgi:sulfite exporter TauE/SafE